MCIGNLFSRPKTPPPPPVPNAPTPPPEPQETQVAPVTLPETPTPGAADVGERQKKADVATTQTQKETSRKGTAGLATQKAEGTGIQSSGAATQGVITLGTVAEARAGRTSSSPRGSKKQQPSRKV